MTKIFEEAWGFLWENGCVAIIARKTKKQKNKIKSQTLCEPSKISQPSEFTRLYMHGIFLYFIVLHSSSGIVCILQVKVHLNHKWAYGMLIAINAITVPSFCVTAGILGPMKRSHDHMKYQRWKYHTPSLFDARWKPSIRYVHILHFKFIFNCKIIKWKFPSLMNDFKWNNRPFLLQLKEIKMIIYRITSKSMGIKMAVDLKIIIISHQESIIFISFNRNNIKKRNPHILQLGVRLIYW